MEFIVSNLEKSVDDLTLKHFLHSLGFELSYSSIEYDHFTNESRGFAFVELIDSSLESTFISTCSGQSLNNRNIMIKSVETIARPARRFK